MNVITSDTKRPLLEIIEAENNLPVATLAGRHLGSTYNPCRQALDWYVRLHDLIEAVDIIHFVGGASGYQIAQTLAAAKNKQIVVWDFHSALRIYLQENVDRFVEAQAAYMKSQEGGHCEGTTPGSIQGNEVQVVALGEGNDVDLLRSWAQKRQSSCVINLRSSWFWASERYWQAFAILNGRTKEEFLWQLKDVWQVEFHTPPDGLVELGKDGALGIHCLKEVREDKSLASSIEGKALAALMELMR